ncbi:YeeE/YedE family protein [Pseudomonas sp. CCI3.2]|uniref:YeeE/YedE family protein n=1 Tax=unclassified Pseudomonas TaxID=196821 RepID=UPI002AC9A372|nr:MULTISPECIES: YeeE/YedE family protein [unclassified Pseudomonas]MEB0079711.1 YeeE/YedE family protein [Pseudomonas sp. MH10out]MEB0092688.1 YeeE/YedE family protein [Pseudomonas sp. CCI4.2]MEB0103907.1 YeeE/YedE family protein [Pseudomonas sp. CCI3.2]MEB0122485.1 YeeE/YedE family protein [Pseudomonas sp. CCI1.2]MEB0132182.1 YeeE/YedE family protein [Pseudomonas sp. CCI2.4]
MSLPLSATPARKPAAPLIAFVLLLFGAAFLQNSVGSRLVLLLVVGAALGLTLYHAAFGFTSAWRVFISDRRGAGLRAQMVMLAVAVVLFFPALGAGSLFGQPVVGLVAPAGISVVVGAFMFGIGMQLGGGCASGTLFTVGGGNARMLVTLLFFIVGSFIATHHVDWWFSLPSFPAISIVKSFGVYPALVMSLALFAIIAAVTVRLEKRRHGQLEEGVTSEHIGLRRFLRGPWPLVWGAIGLALLNYATLALAGRPWGITSAFALWGAKVASGLGVDVGSWVFWQLPGNAKALAAPVWEDVTSVMDIGIMLGALLAAGLAGRFAPNLKIPARSLIAAVIGGLLLGYGSRLAYGCNIGAYFSGIASGSLHGWVWLVAAFIGNGVGVKLRPYFFVGERPQVALSGC